MTATITDTRFKVTISGADITATTIGTQGLQGETGETGATGETGSMGDMLVVAKSGGEYTTIQSAIDVCTGGETVQVFPGTYTETITFDVNDVSIMGMGRPENTIITQANANIIDFGAQTGNSISNIGIRLTAPTDGTKHAVILSTGTAQLRFCALYLATASAIASSGQPHIVNVSGTGTLSVHRGTAIYQHTGATSNGIKVPFYCGAGGTIKLYRLSDIDIDNSGAALGTAIFAHTTSGTLRLMRCSADIDDDDATITAGLGYLAGTATDIECKYNDIHVHGADNNVYGVYVTNADIRLSHNHIYSEVSGSGNAYTLFEAGTGSITSHFDDLVGLAGSSGNIEMVSSEVDGGLSIIGGDISVVDVSGYTRKKINVFEGWLEYDDADSEVILGILPANHFIFDIGIYVNEAFDSGTSDEIRVGYDTDEDCYSRDVSVQTAGVMTSWSSLGINPGVDARKVIGTQRTLKIYYEKSGSAPSQGKVHVFVRWLDVTAIPS